MMSGEVNASRGCCCLKFWTRTCKFAYLVLMVPAVGARHHGLLLERHDVAHDVGELLVADVPGIEALPRLVDDHGDHLALHDGRVRRVHVLEHVAERTLHRAARTTHGTTHGTAQEGSGTAAGTTGAAEGVHSGVATRTPWAARAPGSMRALLLLLLRVRHGQQALLLLLLPPLPQSALRVLLLLRPLLAGSPATAASLVLERRAVLVGVGLLELGPSDRRTLRRRGVAGVLPLLLARRSFSVAKEPDGKNYS